MQVYGVDIKVDPVDVIDVDANGYVREDVPIKYTINPPEYIAISASVFIYRNGVLVAAIPGDQQGTGTVTLSQGFQFDISGDYEAEVVLNYGSSVEIKSDKVPLVYLVETDGRNFGLDRTHHLSEYDSSIEGLAGSEYTDSYQVHAFHVGTASTVSVQLKDSQSNVRDTLVSETSLPPGDYRFVVDYASIKSAMLGADDPDYFYLLLTMEHADGSGKQYTTYHGNLRERTDGRMLGQVMVHDVLIQDGSLNLTRQDVAFKGRGPQFAFTRSYNNQSSASQEFKPLGEGWSHSLDLKLRPLSSDASGAGSVPDWVFSLRGSFFQASDIPPNLGLTMVQVNGNVFKKAGGTWYPERGHHGSLDETGVDFVFTAKDGTRYRYPKFPFSPMPVAHIEDRNGNAMTFAYDQRGRLMSVTDAVGRVFAFTYDYPPGVWTERLMKVTGPDELELFFSYDEHGYLAGTQRGARIETYEYQRELGAKDLDYNLVKTTDANGNVYSYEYHGPTELPVSLGNFVKALKPYDVVKSVGYPDGNAARFVYDTAGGNRRIVTDLNGQDTAYTLNFYGNPNRIEAPEGKVTSMTWSIDEGKDDNVMTSKTDGRGFTTSFDYDRRGNIAVERDPYGHSVTTSWNQRFSLPESRTDRNSVTRTWSYDPANGNLLWQKDGDGKTSSFTYYPNGEVQTATDPRGYTTSYEYDQWGNPALMTGPEGSVTASVYDIRGRKVSVTDPNGYTTQYRYDVLDYPREVLHPPITAYNLPAGSSPIESFTYDPMGNKLTETNRNGLQLSYSYTPRNQVDTVTRSTGGQKSYQYDGNGNLLSETDWKGQPISHAYNGLNQRIATTNRLGHSMHMAYDPEGNLLESSDYEGRVTSYEYDRLNRQTDVWQPALPGQERGHIHNAYYDEADPKTNLKSVTDQEGATTTTEYNGRYLPNRRINALNDVFTRDYDDSGNLVRETDEEQNFTRHEYDKQNRRVATIQMGGIETRYRYDMSGNRIEVTDPRGNTVRTAYDEWNRPYRVTDADGYVSTTEQDGEGNKVKTTDSNGGVRTWVRDVQGRVIQAVNAENFTTSYTYDLNDNVRAVKEPNLTVTETSYDAEDRPTTSTETALDGASRTKAVVSRDKVGNPLEVRDYLGNITTTEYNALNLPERIYDPAPFNAQSTVTTYYRTGKVKTVTNRRGFTTSHEYDALGRETRVTDARNQVMETTFNKVGKVKTLKDKRGIVKENFYDPLYQLERVEKDAIRLLTNEYDPNGNVSSVIDANGNRTEYTYNKRNLKETTKFPATAGFPQGTVESRTYDGVGNLSTLTNEEGKLTSYSYDRENRQTSVSFAGETTRKTYDAVGNPTATIKPKGNRRVMAYDGFKRLTSVTDDPDGLKLTTRYWYDANNNLINQYDVRGNRSSFGYDALNRKTHHTRWKSSGNLVTRYSQYDEEGNLKETVDPKGQVFTYDYDELGRQTDAYFPDVATAFNTITRIHKDYDPNNNLVTVTEYKTDPDGSLLTDVTLNQYDPFDRLEASTQSLANTQQPGGPPNEVSLSYGYDANGNRTGVSTPAGATAYTYDARNRIETATADGLTTNYSYYADGKKAYIAYPNGTSVEYAYHPTNRVQSVTNKSGETVLSHYAYLYDANGNRGAQTEYQNGATETTTYSYDDLDRLTDFTVTGGAGNTKVTAYTFEGYNRKTETLTENGTLLKSQTYSYDETDWLTRIDDQGKVITYHFDANGNTLRKSDNTLPNQDTVFTYDSRNQLVESKRGPPASETILGLYDYNAQGLRTRHRLSDRGDIDYYYDGRSVVEERTPSDNSLVAHYRYADRLISLQTASTTQYYHYDALGSTVNLTNGNGSTPVSYQLDPWGHIKNQFGTSTNRHIFTGKEHDPNTNLIYFGARYYDPDTARFLTQDPYLGELNTPPSLHRYLYAYSNPTVYIDLYGYFSFDEMLKIIAHPMGPGAAIAKMEMQWLGRQIDHEFATNSNLNETHAVGAAAVMTALTVAEGAIDMPQILAEQTKVFFSEPKLENLPVLGPQGKAIGESWGKAAEEGGFVNYSVAVGNSLLGFDTALGGAGIARSVKLPGTYGNRPIIGGRTTKPDVNIEPGITDESRIGAPKTESRPIELSPTGESAVYEEFPPPASNEGLPPGKVRPSEQGLRGGPGAAVKNGPEFTDVVLDTGEVVSGEASGSAPIGSTRHLKLSKTDNGAYKIEFESGKGYAGKGGTTRARRSARQRSRKETDAVQSIEHVPASSNEEAFKLEAQFLDELGGPASPNNYNVINSPGKNLE
jgi:RHS repeat-associated protein